MTAATAKLRFVSDDYVASTYRMMAKGIENASIFVI
jgi:hypothetical protein